MKNKLILSIIKTHDSFCPENSILIVIQKILHPHSKLIHVKTALEGESYRTDIVLMDQIGFWWKMHK